MPPRRMVPSPLCRPLDPARGDLSKLHALWNSAAATQPLSFCWPVPAAAFAAELDPAMVPLHAPVRLQHRRIWVTDAADGVDELVGFVDCSVDPAHRGVGRQSLGYPAIEHPRRGMVRWLWYQPEAGRAAGEALLDVAEAHLTQDGCEELVAFDDHDNYAWCHIGHAFLSDHASHIHALFEARGYRRFESEVFYSWRDYQAATASRGSTAWPELMAAAAEARAGLHQNCSFFFETVPGRGMRPSGVLRVTDQSTGAALAICECNSAGERTVNQAAQDTFLGELVGQTAAVGRLLRLFLWDLSVCLLSLTLFFLGRRCICTTLKDNYCRLPPVSWLGVPPEPTEQLHANHPSQSKGLGKVALTAALEGMAGLGYQHVAISTRGQPLASGSPTANSRAQLFYATYGGFEISDWTYGLRRRLPTPPLSRSRPLL